MHRLKALLSAIWARVCSPRRPPPLARSRRARERVTDWERAFIWNGLTTGGPSCPDCERGRLCAGPEGGASVNCRCDACGATFNLAIWAGGLDADRLTDSRLGTLIEEDACPTKHSS